MPGVQGFCLATNAQRSVRRPCANNPPRPRDFQSAAGSLAAQAVRKPPAGWSAGLTDAVLKLIATSRNMARLFNRLRGLEGFRCPPGVQHYVGRLSCQRFNLICLYFRRDRIAQFAAPCRECENTRVHRSLGTCGRSGTAFDSMGSGCGRVANSLRVEILSREHARC